MIAPQLRSKAELGVSVKLSVLRMYHWYYQAQLQQALQSRWHSQPSDSSGLAFTKLHLVNHVRSSGLRLLSWSLAVAALCRCRALLSTPEPREASPGSSSRTCSVQS